MSRKSTKEEYSIRLENAYNGKILVIGDYTNMNTKTEHKCTVCGSSWCVEPGSLLRKRLPGCKECNRRAKSLSTQEYADRLKQARDDVVVLFTGVFKNMHTAIPHKCLHCGNIWAAKPQNILINKTKCPECSYNDSLKTSDQYKEELANINPSIFAIESYLGAKVKISHECSECNNTFKAMPTNTLKGRGCPYCNSSGFSNGIAAYLYYVCINNIYYKIGITHKEVLDRFKGEAINIRIVFSHKFDLGVDAKDLEADIKKEFKSILGKEVPENLLKYTGNTEIANFDFLELDYA